MQNYYGYVKAIYNRDNMILVLLGLTSTSITLPETLAPGTNVTDTTNREVNQATVVIPFGSSASDDITTITQLKQLDNCNK